MLPPVFGFFVHIVNPGIYPSADYVNPRCEIEFWLKYSPVRSKPHQAYMQAIVTEVNQGSGRLVSPCLASISLAT